jgi:transposase InsO family protein
VRATRPHEYWHIDATIIRLLDGTRLYLHAVIDNFSRRILAWNLATRLEPQSTCAILIEAAKGFPDDAGTRPSLLTAVSRTSTAKSTSCSVSGTSGACLRRSRSPSQTR